MTISPPADQLAGLRPRFGNVPPYSTSAGREAVDLAASAGLVLDPWQSYVLDVSLGERADGRWAAFEVALLVPRQNGKGAILEARELAGLFLFGERLILHSAHEFKTAQEAFRRVLALIDGSDHLRKLVAPRGVRTSHGEEGIELRSGARLRFVARSTGSGRGFSGDTVIFDEAYNLSADSMAAMLPTLSARPNPQLWYTSSAGMESSEQLTRIRDRGRTGNDPGLAYFEYAADNDADLDDEATWRDANPALGIRIASEFVARERAALPEAEFARERLGLWADARHRDTVIDLSTWAALADPESQALDPVAFAVDVTPDRSSAAIAMAGRRADGLLHTEVIETARGTGWAPARLAELAAKWRPCAIVLDASGPAGSLLPDLLDLRLAPVTTSAREMGQACGAFYDAAVENRLRHLDQPSLTTALEAARKRPLGDAWAWHRRDSGADISPLVAATLALYGHATHGAEGAPNLW